MYDMEQYFEVSSLMQLFTELTTECKKSDMFSIEHCVTISQLSDENIKILTEKEKDGYTLLCLATKYEKVKIMNYLLNVCKAKIALNDSLHPMQCAKSFEVVKCLVEHGADVNVPLYQGYTPLHLACQHPDLNTVRYLVKHGANITSATNSGETPVLHACYFERFEIVRYLVELGMEQGVDVLKPKKSGRTCLHEAVKDYDTCALLLKYGADVNSPDSDRNTPLHMAIYSGKYKLFKLFMEHQGDPTLRNKSGEDALRLSCIRYKRKIAEHLLKHGEYSIVERAKAYELMGCGIILKYENPNFSKGGMSISTYWKTALEIKQKNMEEFTDNDNKIIDKRTMQQSIYRNVTELLTEQDFDNLDSDEIAVCIHTLLVLERILGPDHWAVISNAHIINNIFFKKQQYQMCVDLLFHLLRLKTFKCGVKVASVYLEVGILSDIFLKISTSNFVPRFRDIFKLIEAIADLLAMVHVNMENFLTRIIQLLHMMIQMPKNECEVFTMKRLVRKMVRSDICNEFKETLLHRAISDLSELNDDRNDYTSGISFPLVVDLLLECGHKVDVRNSFQETPLSIALQARDTDVIRSLIAHGARDPNNANLVEEFGLPERIPEIDSSSVQVPLLMCIAAQTIVEHLVPYENAPCSIIKYIEDHK